jgi:TPR repeat protein
MPGIKRRKWIWPTASCKERATRRTQTIIAGWFEEAAASGDLIAAFNLGVCLVKGVGVERDEEQAAAW